MKLPISVILPFYLNEDTLAGSIESILNQTFKEIELLLIDNNSNDASYEIASDFAKQDSRIRIISELRQGSVYALNKGIEHAQGDYIAIVDARDESLPERLEKQFKYLEQHSNTGLVACLVNYLGDEEFNYGGLEYVKWSNSIISYDEIAANRFINSPVLHASVLYRKDLIEKHGSYVQGDMPADYELCLRYLDKGVSMHKLPEVLINWKDASERYTPGDNRHLTLSIYETKTSFLYNWLKQNNPNFPKVAVWGAGRLSRQRWALLHDLGVSAKFFIDQRANPNKNVIELKHTPPAGKNFIVSYMAHREAREQVKSFLVELGYMEGKDFICFA